MGIIQCVNCGYPYPQINTPYRCPKCGGTFDYLRFPTYDLRLHKELPGIWRYKNSFGLDDQAPIISLGEGNTPLIDGDICGQKVWFKCEYQNPTGSYKDRGAATLFSFLLSRGVTEAIEDSSGNAGAAFAAYAARAGVKGKVYVPDSISGPKCHQIESYGVELVRILGSRSKVAEQARKAAESGFIYASHAYLPQVLPGYATAAYEIFEQLGDMPGTIVTPVGQGNFLIGLARGFRSLQDAYNLPKLPVFIGVQAQVCAPLWALFSFGPAGLQWVSESPTIAEGVRVSHPVRGDNVLQEVASSAGTFVVVEEERILPARDELAVRGFYVEPTSALVWDAVEQLMKKNLVEPVVVLLTGSGLKSQE